MQGDRHPWLGHLDHTRPVDVSGSRSFGTDDDSDELAVARALHLRRERINSLEVLYQPITMGESDP